MEWERSSVYINKPIEQKNGPDMQRCCCVSFFHNGGEYSNTYSLLRRRGPHRFAAFDLLWLDGRDLRMLPLLERKRRLRALIDAHASCLLYVDHIEGGGADFYRLACEQDLEGVVAKLKIGPYTPEATTWVKIRNPTYSQAEGRWNLFEKRVHAASV